MLNEMDYERETNCSGMLRTSSKLQLAQHVHRVCSIHIHANEPATAWPDPPRLIQCIIPHCITGIERGVFRLVDQKWYAPRPSNFVNVWIWCSGTFPCFPHVCNGNVGHVTTG